MSNKRGAELAPDLETWIKNAQHSIADGLRRCKNPEDYTELLSYAVNEATMLLSYTVCQSMTPMLQHPIPVLEDRARELFKIIEKQIIEDFNNVIPKIHQRWEKHKEGMKK